MPELCYRGCEKRMTSSFSGTIIFLVLQNYCVICPIFKVGLEKQRCCRRCTEAQIELDGCEDRGGERAL